MSAELHTRILIAVGGLAILLFVDMVTTAWQRRRKLRKAQARLRAEWGQPRSDARAGEAPGYFHTRVRGATGGWIDDQTWADLDLDLVFAHFDRTESTLGREVLYDRLRSTSHTPASLREFDATVERFRASEAARLPLQAVFASVGERTSTSLWQLAVEPLPPLARWTAIFPLFTVVMIGLVIGAVVNTYVWLAVLGGLVLSMLLRAKLTWQIAPLVAPFKTAGRVLGIARTIAALEPAAEPATQLIRERLSRLSRLERIAGWIGRDPTRSDPAGVLLEYLNFVLGVDGTAVWFGVREANRQQQSFREVAEALGGLEAAIAVASVRAGATAWIVPRFVEPGAEASLLELRHPLVADCVPNSLQLAPSRGILLTGANMTGKSTLLRTAGVNAVLAQSINTVFASRYETPWLRVRSCISPSDDLSAHKSLYQREVEIVVALMREAGTGGTTLCLFDELFRGTNSIDRISASEAILGYLLGAHAPLPRTGRCLVIAATHDLELVGLLDGLYDAFHFGDEMTPSGPQFDHRLHPGPATTRNAIALLEFFGAPASVIANARNTAARRSAHS